MLAYTVKASGTVSKSTVVSLTHILNAHWAFQDQF